MNVAPGIVRGRRARTGMLMAAGLVAFFAVYTWFLGYQEARVKEIFAGLRTSNPDLYLTELSKVVGFDRYLREYRSLKGYDRFRSDVPPFLLGRWALFPEAKRVSDFYFADNCINSIIFEDGFVKTSGEVTAIHAVDYRLDGNTVTLQLHDGANVPVTLVSYGVRLHHVELTLPGFPGTRYGYLCK